MKLDKILFQIAFLLMLLSCSLAVNAQEGEPEVKEESIFIIVETPPSFPGGLGEFYNYVKRTIEYPEEAKKKKIEGKVFLSFIINKKGEIERIKVVRDIGGGCAEEAIRVLKSSGKWNPGMQRGRPVNTRMTLPIQFKLDHKKKK